MTDRRGFTLIELMTTIIILGILVTLAMPAVNEIIQLQQLRSEARKVASQLRGAQQEAITTEAAQTITFQPATETYLIGTKLHKLVDSITYARVGVTDPEASFTLTFDTLGVPTPVFTLTLQDTTGRKIYVRLSNTGRVNISDTLILP